MVRQRAPWFENISKRQVKSPKVFIRDSGLLHALLGIDNRRGRGETQHPQISPIDADWISKVLICAHP